MTVRPIIFSGPMMSALMQGRKTMTRRYAWSSRKDTPDIVFPSHWAKAKVGDRLYVRENLYAAGDGKWKYADGEHVLLGPSNMTAGVGWAHHEERSVVPSIHMPRWASRLTLILTEVRLEHLKDITEGDCFREGVGRFGDRDFRIADLGVQATDPIGCFSALWWHLHGIGAWDENPEVVAMSFNVIKKNIDVMELAA